MKKNKGLLNNLFGIGIDLGEDEVIEKDEKNNFNQMSEDTEIEIEEIKDIKNEVKDKEYVAEETYQNFLKEDIEKEIHKINKIEKKEEKIEKKVDNYVDATSYQNVVSRIKGFEDSKKIARYIKENKIVTLNLEELDNETAQRVIDFLSGAMSMKDANLVEISKYVYVSVPKNQRVLFEGQREKNFFREVGK